MAAGHSVGRPRHTGRQPSTAVAPRDEILDAAARLFVTRGVAGTSTREIAEATGIRQASLYYHFANKDEIVEELLDRSLRPTLDKIEKVEFLGAPHGAATSSTQLYILLVLDVRTLALAPHNAGVLARLPEVQRQGYFDRYRAGRNELREAYDRLGAGVLAEEGSSVAAPAAAVPGHLSLGSMLLQLAEVVIRMRGGDRPLAARVDAQIATSGLRLCGVSAPRIEAAELEAGSLIGAFDEL
jgi:AcrR family transcriptional regulator